jgi:hypothetical protein
MAGHFVTPWRGCNGHPAAHFGEFGLGAAGMAGRLEGFIVDPNRQMAEPALNLDDMQSNCDIERGQRETGYKRLGTNTQRVLFSGSRPRFRPDIGAAGVQANIRTDRRRDILFDRFGEENYPEPMISRPPSVVGPATTGWACR